MARTKGTPGSKPLLAADASAQHRRNQALKLRIESHTQAEIAAILGVKQPAVSKMLKNALRAEQAEGEDALRQLEYQRMELLHQQMGKAAKQGHAGAGNVIVRASERRSKLMGLDELPSENGNGGGVLVSVWVQALTLDTPEALTAVLDAAKDLGIQAASAHEQLMPDVIARHRRTCCVSSRSTGAHWTPSRTRCSRWLPSTEMRGRSERVLNVSPHFPNLSWTYPQHVPIPHSHSPAQGASPHEHERSPRRAATSPGL